MHRKTQFMASVALVYALAAQPETHEAMDLLMRNWEEGVTVTPEHRPIPSQGRLAVARRLFAGYAALPAALRDSSLLYFMVGSLNKDTRGMALDGEAIAVVSGEWSLVAWLDFWSLFGSTTWIERRRTARKRRASERGIAITRRLLLVEVHGELGIIHEEGTSWGRRFSRRPTPR